jgi:methyl-accepting chemotaxis protein
MGWLIAIGVFLVFLAIFIVRGIDLCADRLSAILKRLDPSSRVWEPFDVGTDSELNKEDRLSQIFEQLERMETGLDALNRKTLASLDFELSQLRQTVESIRSDVHGIESGVRSMSVDMGRITSDVGKLEDSVGSIGSNVSAIETDVGNIANPSLPDEEEYSP